MLEQVDAELRLWCASIDEVSSTESLLLDCDMLDLNLHLQRRRWISIRDAQPRYLIDMRCRAKSASSLPSQKGKERMIEHVNLQYPLSYRLCELASSKDRDQMINEYDTHMQNRFPNANRALVLSLKGLNTKVADDKMQDMSQKGFAGRFHGIPKGGMFSLLMWSRT